MIFRAFRYKLSPTVEQEVAFRQHAGVCRLVYNLALEQRRDFWRQYLRTNGRRIDYASQCRDLTLLRMEFDWVAAVSATAQNQALRDLEKAFNSFFTGKSKYPSPRVKGANESFRFKGVEISICGISAKWSAIKLPKIGWVKFRDTRTTRGKIKTVTVSMDSLGWHISLACEIDCLVPNNISPSVGIDRGVANTLALSTGEVVSIPASLDFIERRKCTIQRIVARRKKGSKRRLKAIQKVARLSAKRARIRRDWHHKAALNIAQRFGTVVMEDLKITNMTASAAGTVEAPGRNVRQKAGLNRSILNQGWYSFESILAYKLEERGGTLIKVPAMYTSQTCASCGTIDRKSRESQAVFICQHCGHRDHADVNAAINILRGNTAWTRMEDGRQATVEVRTGLDREVHENHLASAG